MYNACYKGCEFLIFCLLPVKKRPAYCSDNRNDGAFCSSPFLKWYNYFVTGILALCLIFGDKPQWHSDNFQPLLGNRKICNIFRYWCYIVNDDCNENYCAQWVERFIYALIFDVLRVIVYRCRPFLTRDFFCI